MPLRGGASAPVLARAHARKVPPLRLPHSRSARPIERAEGSESNRSNASGFSDAATCFDAHVVREDWPKMMPFDVTPVSARVVNRAFYTTPPPEPETETQPVEEMPVDVFLLALSRRMPLARERLLAAFAELPKACDCVQTADLGECECALPRVRMSDFALLIRHDPPTRQALNWPPTDVEAEHPEDLLNQVEAKAVAEARQRPGALLSAEDVLLLFQDAYAEYLLHNEDSPPPSPSPSTASTAPSSPACPPLRSLLDAPLSLTLEPIPARDQDQDQDPGRRASMPSVSPTSAASGASGASGTRSRLASILQSHDMLPPTLQVTDHKLVATMTTPTGVTQVLSSPVDFNVDDEDWVATGDGDAASAPLLVNSMPQLGALIVNGRRRSHVRRSTMGSVEAPDPWAHRIAAHECDRLDFHQWRRRMKRPFPLQRTAAEEEAEGQPEEEEEDDPEAAPKPKFVRPKRIHDGTLSHSDGRFVWSCCQRFEGEGEGCVRRPRSPRATELEPERSPRPASAPRLDEEHTCLQFRADSYNTVVHLHSSKEAQLFVAQLRSCSSGYLVR